MILAQFISFLYPPTYARGISDTLESSHYGCASFLHGDVLLTLLCAHHQAKISKNSMDNVEQGQGQTGRSLSRCTEGGMYNPIRNKLITVTPNSADLWA
jgi:hypothetical protein